MVSLFPKPINVVGLCQVASKTNDVAGDGTTSATVLTRAIFREGCKVSFTLFWCLLLCGAIICCSGVFGVSYSA